MSTDNEKPPADPSKITLGQLLRSLTIGEFAKLLAVSSVVFGLGYKASSWVTEKQLSDLTIERDDLKQSIAKRATEFTEHDAKREMEIAQHEAKDAILRKWYLYQMAKEKVSRAESLLRLKAAIGSRLQLSSVKDNEPIMETVRPTITDNQQLSEATQEREKTGNDLQISVREWEKKDALGAKLIKVTRGTEGTASVEFLCGGPPLVIPEEFTPGDKAPRSKPE